MEHNGCLPCAETPVIGFILSRFCGVPVFTHSVGDVLIVSCHLRLYFSSSLFHRRYAFFFSPPHEGHTRRGSHSWSIRRINFILQEYLKYIGSNFCCFLVLSRTLCGMINIIGNKLHPDFRPPTLCRWGLHSSETFRSVRYVTDVSGPYRLHLQFARHSKNNSSWTAWLLKMGHMLSRNVGHELPTCAVQHRRRAKNPNDERSYRN